MYFKNGFFLGLYRIFAAATVITCLSAVVNKDEPVSANGYVNNPIKMINLFSLLLPIWVVLYDSTTAILLERKEYWIVVLFKYLVAAVYFTILIVTLVSFSSDDITVTTIY